MTEQQVLGSLLGAYLASSLLVDGIIRYWLELMVGAE